MPIYEYECEGCQQVFEVRQKISDPAPSTHTCGSTKVRRILSATTFVLKGTGWYKTDYADKKPQTSAQQGEGGDARSSGEGKQGGDNKQTGSGDAKESKPAAKPDAATKAPAKSDASRKAE